MKIIKKQFPLALITLAIVATPSAFAEGSIASGITNALSDSKANLSFRARYEGVNQDGVANATNKDATAVTIRSRITLKTGAYQGLSFGLEVDNVTALVDDYNDLTFDYSGDDAVIADPEITDINQAYVKYTNGGLKATVGRQRILQNNQRFVGGVGWRQNEQTYDGVRVEYKLNDSLSVDYSYIHNANRIFADSKKGEDLHGAFHFLNVPYKINTQHKVSAFSYVLDFDTAAKLSTSTYGGLYKGKFGPVFVNASVASQSDNADNPNNYTAAYLNAELGYKADAVTVLAGYELLGSDNGVGFTTPFATLHKFQGFADKFLATPGQGIQDLYVTAVTKVSGVKLVATYHNLTSDVDGIDYGNELDLVAVYKINKSYGVLAKFAVYSADDKATDTNKLWIQATAKF